MSQIDDGWIDSTTERLVDVLVDNVRRQYLLISVAYVTGSMGLALIFVPTRWLPVSEETVLVVSILLMGVSFLSLFLASIAAPGTEDA